MSLPKTFESAAFERFSWSEVLEQLFSKAPVACEGFFVISDSFCRTAHEVIIGGGRFLAQEITWYQDPTLAQYGYTIGFLDVLKNSHDPEHFLSQLLRWEIKIIKFFLDVLHEHLSQRFSNEKRISDYENVRSLIAQVYSNLILLECNIESCSLGLADEIISQMIAGLMKLAGGRAFVTGSIIDLKNLFGLLNNIYLFDQPATVEHKK